MSSTTFRVLDGSMGLYLLHTGVPKSNQIWSAAALIDPKYHSHVITTNNYACTPYYLAKIGMQHHVESLTKLCVSLAHQARDEFVIQRKHNLSDNHHCAKIQIAGSIPPLNESYRADLRLSEQASINCYSRIVQSLQAGKGVDIFLIETMSCLEEALYALRAIAANQAHSNANPKSVHEPEIFVSFSLNNAGNLRSDEDINDVIEKLQGWMAECNITLLAFNCCTPESIERALDRINGKSLRILEEHNVFLGAYPNGTVEIKPTWTLQESGYNPIRQDLPPQLLYAKFYKPWMQKYYGSKRLRCIGGCCNIEPQHIDYLTKHIETDFPQLLSTKSKL